MGISIGEKPDVGLGERCIETTMDMAVGFLEGTLNLQQFVIPDDNAPADESVVSKANLPTIKSYWMLEDAASTNSAIEIVTVGETGITVRSRIGNNLPISVYVTKKDSPNSLVCSGVIPESFDDTVFIPFDSKKDFSVYARRHVT